MIWLALIPVYLLIYRLLRYVTTPLFRWLGVYRYYSPMFFTVSFGPSLREIHLGTPYDYFLKRNRAKPMRILGFLCAGLASICREVEAGSIPPGMEFRGMVHYLSKESMTGFGLRLRRPNPMELFLFSLGYLELCLMSSIAHKRINLIRLRDLWVVNFTAADLMEHRSRYEALARKLVPELYPNPTSGAMPPVSKSA